MSTYYQALDHFRSMPEFGSIRNAEEPFDYMETYVPPFGQGCTRHASARLIRDRRQGGWVREPEDPFKWVLDDFGFLKAVNKF